VPALTSCGKARLSFDDFYHIVDGPAASAQ
jgi:hypothetical protein